MIDLSRQDKKIAFARAARDTALGSLKNADFYARLNQEGKIAQFLLNVRHLGACLEEYEAMIEGIRKAVPMQPMTVIAAVRTGAMALDYRSVIGALILSAFGVETSASDAEIEYGAMLKGYNTTDRFAEAALDKALVALHDALPADLSAPYLPPGYTNWRNVVSNLQREFLAAQAIIIMASSLNGLGKILGIGEAKLFNPTTALSAIKTAIATLLATGPPKCKKQRAGDKSPEDVYQTMLARFNNNPTNPAAMKNFVEAAINLIKCLKGGDLPKGPTPA